MRFLLLVSAIALIQPAATVHAQESGPPSPPVATSFLMPGDVIRLKVWRDESMSTDYRVNPDGTAVLPRLGNWQVTGKDPAALREELQREYARYLRDASIDVTYLRRILVGGAVMRPGVYYIDPTMTVRDALLEAGGPTPSGRTDRIELIRDGEQVEARVREDLTIIESAVRSGDQLSVPERSWLARNTGAAVGIGSALLSFTATMIILAASR